MRRCVGLVSGGLVKFRQLKGGGVFLLEMGHFVGAESSFHLFVCWSVSFLYLKYLSCTKQIIIKSKLYINGTEYTGY